MAKKRKFYKSSYAEVSDRIHAIQVSIDTHLYNHPVFDHHPKWRDKLDKIQAELTKLYQKTTAKILN